MPELPEVHTTTQGLVKTIVGLTVSDVWTDYNSPFHAGKPNIKNPKFFKEFKKVVVGAKVTSVTRRAKNILIHLSNKHTILIHMKMTGHVMYGSYQKKRGVWKATEEGPLQDPFNQWIHFVVSFSNPKTKSGQGGKQIVLSDMRKFAKVTLLETESLEAAEDLKKTGPEPLDLTKKEFKEIVMKRPNGKIKQVLMNHEVIAGIGNIYSDEMLWRAGIHPLEQIANITEKQWSALYPAMKQVLEKGIELKGDSTSDYRNIDGRPGKFHAHHRAYQRTGETCEKRGCKGKIERTKVGGRSAHFCSKHQKKN